MDITHLDDIITVIIISIVMVISPGQDFAMITKNSLVYSRRIGIISAFGIFSAIWVHVAYSLAGIAIVISSTPVLYGLIKYAGALYLFYLGVKGLINKNKNSQLKKENSSNEISSFIAFQNGFLSNVLNPKTTLFFLSIFTQVVNIDTPLLIQFIFGLIIAISHLVWFIVVAYFFSSRIFILKFNHKKYLIEKVMGGILILFAIKIFVS